MDYPSNTIAISTQFTGVNFKDLIMPNSEAVVRVEFLSASAGAVAFVATDVEVISSTVHTLFEHISHTSEAASLVGIVIGTTTTIKKHIFKKTKGTMSITGSTTLELTADSGA
jgi:hypothetical protein